MIKLKLIIEEPDNAFSDVLILFTVTEKDETYVLRGRVDGYEKNAKGYIEVPINSKIEKLYHQDVVATYPTERFDSIIKRNMQILWEYLVKQKQFELDEE